ncbi:hypothetical protein BDA96_09G246500 [Sorghum bicolor]|uniref:Uncharacterized protein n=1 Tax=Sorghum bicolor TaxID=4558 RepID=A0A921QC51_SORBI|nr:hypothetical protein BDA96_09G246500 [Sorghum bicolor]
MHCVGGGSPRRRPGRRMVRRGGARHLQLLPRHQQRHDVQRVPVACHRRCSPLVCRHRPTSVVAATLAAAVPANVICSRHYGLDEHSHQHELTGLQHGVSEQVLCSMREPSRRMVEDRESGTRLLSGSSLDENRGLRPQRRQGHQLRT